MTVPRNHEVPRQAVAATVSSAHIFDDLRQWTQESEAPDDVVLRYMAAELLDLSADRILNGKRPAEDVSVEGRSLIEDCQLRIAEAFRVNPADVEIRVSFR